MNKDSTFSDPFTGVWAFRPEWSQLSSPSPRRWVKRIECDSEAVHLREDIDFGHGRTEAMEIEVKFDGRLYPVDGTASADAMSYTRVDGHRIEGVASSQGFVTVLETLLLAPDGGWIAMTYQIFNGRKRIAGGRALFERTEILPEEPVQA